MTIWNGLTSDGAVVPIQVDAQGRVIAVGSGPDSPLVVDGDYLRPRDPDLGLGTANIDLDAAGTASFAGKAKVGAYQATSTNPKTNAFEGYNNSVTSATYFAQNNSADDASMVWNGYDSGDNLTSTIKGNGDVTFKGNLGLTGKGGKDTVFYVLNKNDDLKTTVGINADGSSSFGGTMTLFGLTTTSSVSYPVGWISAGQLLALNTSSARYKTDIETADPAQCLDIVNKLRPVWYRSNIETDNPDQSYWGFIAEEVAEVEPRLTAYDAEGLPGSVDYGRFTPVLTSVLQQALTRIEALEAQLAQLQDQ